MLSRNFILPEDCKPCLLYMIFNLRNLSYLIHPNQGVYGSFPKLNIPHQSHADFYSTDTAGRLDNKKRRYAPCIGGSVPLFIVGAKRGKAPIWHTTLIAKCNVLYLLSWRAGKKGVSRVGTTTLPGRQKESFFWIGMGRAGGGWGGGGVYDPLC